MNKITAAGFIIFRYIDNNIEYLLLEASYKKGLWTPPKGHVDPGEDIFQTALRETLEETGLQDTDLTIYPDFREELHYNVAPTPFHPRASDKTVTYWLARLLLPKTPIKLSEEHVNFGWYSIDDALRISKFSDMQKLLTKVNGHLLKDLDSLNHD